nr:hypothetical protein CFP56_63088 [Quercus suber]
MAIWANFTQLHSTSYSQASYSTVTQKRNQSIQQTAETLLCGATCLRSMRLTGPAAHRSHVSQRGWPVGHKFSHMTTIISMILPAPNAMDEQERSSTCSS